MTYSLPEGHTARPATLDDAPRVANLWNDRSEATRGDRPATPERVLRNWDHPKFNLSTDSRLVFAPDDTLIGYAHIRDVKDPPVDVFSGYSIHPDHDDSAWLWDDLFTWLEAEARRVIPKAPPDARVVLVAGSADTDPIEQRELERYGFEHSRTFHRMQINFDTENASHQQKHHPVPDGVGIRAFVPGDDDEALVTAWCDAFSDHYGIIQQPFEAELEEWRQLMRRDDFDPSLWFLPYDTESGTVVGLCVCNASAPGSPGLGRISDVGVCDAWRRRGIGRSLLRHAFGALAQRGLAGAVLVVDSENKSGAPALYERVGMRSVGANHTYVKELRPGVNLVPQ